MGKRYEIKMENIPFCNPFEVLKVFSNANLPIIPLKLEQLKFHSHK